MSCFILGAGVPPDPPREVSLTALGGRAVPPLLFGRIRGSRAGDGAQDRAAVALDDRARGVRDDARTGMPPGVPGGAMCVQRFDGSLNSAIHITYRISLRSSSMPEPRDPLLKVFA